MQTPRFLLPAHSIVTLEGRDAVAFAQAQFMSDLKGLPAGHWHWSGWLTPKGRVIALFALLKLDDERVWLLLHDADPAAFAERLRRFIFRSKVATNIRDDLRALGAFAPPAQAIGATLAIAGVDDIVLDLGAAGGARTLRIAATNPELAAIDDADALARWTAFDLMHGLPRLPASQSEQWTPQQLSLDRLKAYSVKKGCYPGQEIVARTHFLGQAKRGLGLFESDVLLTAGMQVDAGGRTLGDIVSVVTAGGQNLALAVLPPDQAGETLHADNIALRATALLDGLARQPTP